ncbi:hypothetical protein AXK11_00155 [Cephaloticoccus primus]|uniref:D-isomer specific 2-hydroxyacid dehydrogenase NAD-binding domain-containing protein n=1 Tax=Cephaloticoccus primus TaxID=1548207 RepID=A0A139SSX3_9BACT|nr:hydroxyacid dehydrogenase [Cephaloticoccus primus]KXU37685.1 hypothetical protein AXK11_00155 [Cephaloticoccus primus]
MNPSLKNSSPTQAVLALSAHALDAAYGPDGLERLRALTKLTATITPAETWREHRDALACAEVIFSGWEAPLMDAEFLDATPNLRAVFYAAGSVRSFVTEEFWRRGIRLANAAAMNAIPVAEYATAALILGLKHVWHYSRAGRAMHSTRAQLPAPATAYRSTIGLISYGAIARLVRERLRSYDLQVLVYDPFLSAADAAQDDMRKADSLDELFATADAISLHTPHLPETEGLIRKPHLEAMRPGAFFLNTARGQIVDEAALIDVLQRRPDLSAVLDVTHPEPPAPDSPLHTLPNVILTPHLAGSIGPECQRMGQAMLDEFERYRDGQPLRWELTPARAAQMA